MNPRQFDISLRDVRFHAHHGVFPQETVIGNEFLVNLTVTIPAPPHEPSLEETVSYALLYDIVKEAMATPVPLLETLCLRIASKILADFPAVTGGSIEIIKVAPPISGIDGECAVKYRF